MRAAAVASLTVGLFAPITDAAAAAARGLGSGAQPLHTHAPVVSLASCSAFSYLKAAEALAAAMPDAAGDTQSPTAAAAAAASLHARQQDGAVRWRGKCCARGGGAPATTTGRRANRPPRP
jgi:hypothetical protein